MARHELLGGRIGTRRPIVPPELHNGLMVPIVAFDQLYAFDRDAHSGDLAAGEYDRQVLRPLRRNRGVSVPGNEAVALL